MVDEEGQVSNDTDSASDTPPAETPGAEAKPTQEVPQEQPTQPSEETVPLKRLQGLQRYAAQQEKDYQERLKARDQELAGMRDRLRALETKDMTDAERQAYEASEIAREERERREAVNNGYRHTNASTRWMSTGCFLPRITTYH